MSDVEAPLAEAAPEWAAALREHFDERLALSWTKGAGDTWVIVGVAADDSSSTLQALTRELTAQMVSCGVAGFPVLYGPGQWAALGKPAARTFCLDADSRRSLLAAAAKDVRAKRHLLLRAVKADSALVDLVARRSPVPTHTGLRMAADAMRDALRWLFATWEEDVVVGDIESARVFARHCEEDGIFDNNAVQLYWQLEGLALRSQQLFLDPRSGDVLGMWAMARPALAETTRFLRQLERHLTKTVTSKEERAQRRRRLAIGGGLAAVVLVVLFVLRLIGQRPMEPVARSALGKGKPGAITAEYFADSTLLKRVVRRADKQIWINTSRAPTAGLHFDHFSVRWRGYLYFPEAGAKVLCLQVDEGARLTLKDRRLFDNWWHKGSTRRCNTIQVKQGWYPLLIEYFDTTGKSVLQLERGDSSSTASKIPPEHLCCKE